jgi:hypothetical protein
VALQRIREWNATVAGAGSLAGAQAAGAGRAGHPDEATLAPEQSSGDQLTGLT